MLKNYTTPDLNWKWKTKTAPHTSDMLHIHHCRSTQLQKRQQLVIRQPLKEPMLLSQITSSSLSSYWYLRKALHCETYRLREMFPWYNDQSTKIWFKYGRLLQVKIILHIFYWFNIISVLTFIRASSWSVTRMVHTKWLPNWSCSSLPSAVQLLQLSSASHYFQRSLRV